jgi:hypothetical protein
MFEKLLPPTNTSKATRSPPTNRSNQICRRTPPPTPSDLIARIDRVEDMLSNTIKVCESVKRPRTTPSTSSMPIGLSNAARVASRYMKHKIQIESGLHHQDRGSCGSHLNEPCPIHENSKHTAHQCCVLKKLRRPLTTAPAFEILDRKTALRSRSPTQQSP